MPLLPPSLDDRRFDDLVEDLLARIPAHTPEWTHPRPGDPGRTLIELFAWLADTVLYRANLVPERQRLVFLKLLGMGLRPARPAQGIVSLAFAQDSERAVHVLRPGATLKAALPFETRVEVPVLPIAAEAYVKRPLPEAEALRRNELLEGLARIHGVAGAVQGYEARPVFAAGRAEPGGVDVFADSADRALWIALLAPPAPRPTEQAAVNAAVRLAIGGGDGAPPARLSLGVVPALQAPSLFEAAATPPPVPVLWEITTRGRTAFDTGYLPLQLLPGSDSTGGLARAGTLELQLPDEDHLWAPSNDIAANPRAGVGDAPPRLDDPERAARVLAWLRLRPRPGQDVRHLRLAWLGINAATVVQQQTLAGRVLGSSDGAADQVVALPAGAVDAESLEIEVEEPRGGYRPWHRVDDLAAISADPHAAREAAAYQLDAEAGTLRFGDGLRGRVPEREMRIRLARGRFGGGRAGNLPAASLAELAGVRVDGRPAPPIKVTQPLPLAGGEDAETLAEAEKRIPARLRHGDRAVTEADFQRLALEAPAIEVGRVEVLPRFKPRDRRFGVPGVVSVLALPAAPLGPAPYPRPDRPFIERLHAHLSVRVPLATELYVIGCEYVALGLAVAVEVREGFGRDQVLHDVRAALERLLWPLAPGGLARQGWPLGRAVRARELEVEVAKVDGVDELRGLRLFQRAEAAADWADVPQGADGTQALLLRPWQLPELLAVVVSDDAEPAADLRARPNPFAQAQAVAVPVVPEVC